jgi:hypothetical protein
MGSDCSGLRLIVTPRKEQPVHIVDVSLRLDPANCGHEMERGDLEGHRVPKPLAEHIHQH